ncbi:hypothetical protein [Nocardia amikacinitolerans]|uniref:hypothetical protein n=1 Tax=Nocardia amikacinitolerans TaxID=756689 RepID=UPI0015CADFB3|nr:hypothetical protein [Nocardia amikacinitolerans]
MRLYVGRREAGQPHDPRIATRVEQDRVAAMRSGVDQDDCAGCPGASQSVEWIRVRLVPQGADQLGRLRTVGQRIGRVAVCVERLAECDPAAEIRDLNRAPGRTQFAVCRNGFRNEITGIAEPLLPVDGRRVPQDDRRQHLDRLVEQPHGDGVRAPTVRQQAQLASGDHAVVGHRRLCPRERGRVGGDGRDVDRLASDIHRMLLGGEKIGQAKCVVRIRGRGGFDRTSAERVGPFEVGEVVPVEEISIQVEHAEIGFPRRDVRIVRSGERQDALADRYCPRMEFGRFGRASFTRLVVQSGQGRQSGQVLRIFLVGGRVLGERDGTVEIGVVPGEVVSRVEVGGVVGGPEAVLATLWWGQGKGAFAERNRAIDVGAISRSHEAGVVDGRQRGQLGRSPWTRIRGGSRTLLAECYRAVEVFAIARMLVQFAVLQGQVAEDRSPLRVAVLEPPQRLLADGDDLVQLRPLPGRAVAHGEREHQIGEYQWVVSAVGRCERQCVLGQCDRGIEIRAGAGQFVAPAIRGGEQSHRGGQIRVGTAIERHGALSVGDRLVEATGVVGQVEQMVVGDTQVAQCRNVLRVILGQSRQCLRTEVDGLLQICSRAGQVVSHVVREAQVRGDDRPVQLLLDGDGQRELQELDSGVEDRQLGHGHGVFDDLHADTTLFVGVRAVADESRYRRGSRRRGTEQRTEETDGHGQFGGRRAAFRQGLRSRQPQLGERTPRVVQSRRGGGRGVVVGMLLRAREARGGLVEGRVIERCARHRTHPHVNGFRWNSLNPRR